MVHCFVVFQLATNGVGLEFMVPEIRTKYVFVLYLCQTIGSLLTGMVSASFSSLPCFHLQISMYAIK